MTITRDDTVIVNINYVRYMTDVNVLLTEYFKVHIFKFIFRKWSHNRQPLL